MGNLKLSLLFKNQDIDERVTSYFDQVEIVNAQFYKNQDLLTVTLKAEAFLSYDFYQRIKDYCGALAKESEIYISYGDEEVIKNSKDIQSYLWGFSKSGKISEKFKEGVVSIHENRLEILFSYEKNKVEAQNESDKLKEELEKVGLNFSGIEFMVKEINHQVDAVVLPKSAKPQKAVVATEKNNQRIRLKKTDYPVIVLKNIESEVDRIQFEAKIMKIEYRKLKTGNTMQTISVYDEEDALVIKRFETKSLSVEMMEELNVGDRIQFFGSIVYDTYEKEFIGKPMDILLLEEKNREDNAVAKRVELHTHSNISEMDGINDVSDYIKEAFRWGHKAVAITDHAAVQSFPKAQSAVDQLLKSNPDAQFKMIYGVEMNLVDSELSIVRNATNKKIEDCTFVVFDLETTGLSAHFDHVIEFGAVKIIGQNIVDRKQFFIKPPVDIPAFIQSKTNITNEMVENESSFSTRCQEIVDWLGEDVLVAHNASFDIGFLNEELSRLGKLKLKNPVIDTLDLARSLHSDRTTYRLGNIARLYQIPYDEDVAHRADYDANVLADIFLAMLRETKEKGATTLVDIQNLQGDKGFVKMRKSHLCVLAKNQIGLKSLYNLVTLSNTESLAVFRSRGSEFLAEPRIFKENIEMDRENLLIGSACLNGEIFEFAANKSQDELENKMQFYDYVEVQPIENYLFLIQQKTIPNLERLKAILKRIIDTAIKLDKLVVATGDVHYCDPEQKIYRDIYIQTQGIGGVRHPLYVYNEKIRHTMDIPEQHFRTTQEMLKSFSWLNDESFAHEIVVENTNKIADMIEPCLPVPKGLYPPTIEGADEKLSEICYETARKTYGQELPKIVKQRLERELNSIIGNGYGVIYYVSHLLVKKSNDDGYLVGSRGSVGSSFAATMSGITEVNPLEPHYICSHCQHSEFVDSKKVSSGFDLPDKECPQCKNMMRGEGQNIPFETFLGFEGDKVPDIDLNFSGEYQEKAHLFTKEVFGEDHVFRAGTIGTVQDKTAFGYVTGYSEEMSLPPMKRAQKERLALGCTGIKRTTGQHPGGIIVIPQDKEVTDFTPVQYPANDPSSTWKTTHFDFHDIHDNVLKFDILGHVDPTAMRLLQNISGIDPREIPMNDEKVMKLFSSSEPLCVDTRQFTEKTGALGIPEFGTSFVRGILESAKPTCFSDLIIISGLSHGTDVWLNNAEQLVREGLPLQEVIGCRDDIMTYLLKKDVDPKLAFTIMESVRKGKGLKIEWEEAMEEKSVPAWYIESCKKIKYMFPKAHAVAYVIMAVRIAWFKVYYPHWYYISYFSLRCDAYEIETMISGIDAIKARMDDIKTRRNSYELKHTVTKKEEAIYNTLEVCLELYARGYKIGNVDLYHSSSTEFKVDKQNQKVIIPPFVTIDGLGENVANSIVEAREQGAFISKQDLSTRTQCSSTLIKKLDSLGTLSGMQEENQMSLF